MSGGGGGGGGGGKPVSYTRVPAVCGKLCISGNV